MRMFNKNGIVLLTSVIALFSCAELDDKVETGLVYEKPVSVIVNEKISSYDVLKSYGGELVLGANISSANLSGTAALATLLTTNFHQVTPSTELNNSVIVSNNGAYDFSAIDSYISLAKDKGLSVYGDAVVANTNQNDTYLKKAGAPLTYLTPLYPNMINQSPLKDGSFTGWAVNGDVSVENYMGQPAVKMVNGASVAATSLQSPLYVVDENAKFELTVYLLATQVGEGRIVFNGLRNNQPQMDWMGTGTISSTFKTKIGWNAIKVQTTDFDNSGQFSFKIELGNTPNVTYYMNIEGVALINLNGSVENPDEIFLECENAQQIGKWMINQDDKDASGGKTLVGIINGNITADDTNGGSPNAAANQDFQFTYTFNVKTAGVYRFWIRQKAHVADGGYDSFFMSVDGANYYVPGWPAWGNETNTTTWTWFKLYTNSADKEGSSLFNFSAGEHKVAIRIREGGHYFDKMYFTMTTNVPSGFGSAAIAQKEVTLNVSDDVRNDAVDYELKEYVKTVFANVGEDISAWTVVKNPFAQDGSVAVSGGASVAGTYYWADYLGSDYIKTAFGVARTNAGSGTKLFIGETDLNTNAKKLQAVISAVGAISEVDGIAVSLSLDLDTDMELLAAMFDDLAATGKLIYITNLKVATKELTDESFALQSEVYKAAVGLYKSKVPTSQQYGISLEAAVDANGGLWSSDYNRKQAYAGFVVGLGAQE